LARQQQSHLWRNASLNFYILPATPQNFGCQSAEIGFEIRHEQTPFDDQGHEVTTTRWTSKIGGQGSIATSYRGKLVADVGEGFANAQVIENTPDRSSTKA
jgi:hypothetical protein